MVFADYFMSDVGLVPWQFKVFKVLLTASNRSEWCRDKKLAFHFINRISGVSLFSFSFIRRRRCVDVEIN